jgi:hypothetical protein
MLTRALAVLVLMCAASADAQVQRPPVQRGQPRDTAQADTVKFAPPDSVMEALLQKPGYTVTRYEGGVVTFDATAKAFAIAAAAANRAIVERQGQRVVTDSGGSIIYNDQSQSVTVTGHPTQRFQIIPGAGQPPITGSGTATYNLQSRSGRLTNATVTAPDEQGQTWYIRSEISVPVVGDSARGIAPRFYGLGGSLTSCEDSIPD